MDEAIIEGRWILSGCSRKAAFTFLQINKFVNIIKLLSFSFVNSEFGPPRAARACRSPGSQARAGGASMTADREDRVGTGRRAPSSSSTAIAGSAGSGSRRWRGMTGDRVEYRPWQEVGRAVPGDRRGRVPGPGLADRAGRPGPRRGAGPCSGSTPLAGERRWPAWLYVEPPGVRRGRRRRPTTSWPGTGTRRCVATRLLWGSVDRRPSYRRTRAIFLRGLGVVYLAAFWSLAVQVDGLIGSRGIAPGRRVPGRASGRSSGADATGRSRPCSGSTPRTGPCTPSAGAGSSRAGSWSRGSCPGPASACSGWPTSRW